MAIDSSIYFQQRPIDILGGVQRGLQMRDQMDQRAQRQADLQRLEKNRGYETEIQDAYGQSVVQNPDGTTSFDNAKFNNNLGVLAGRGNPLAGKAIYDFGQTQRQQQMDQQAFDSKQQAQDFDNQLKQAQMGKIRAETNELNRKPTDRISKLTDAEKTVDKTFGKDYADWTAGGRESALSEVNKLENVISRLGSDVSTGGLTGILPDRFTSNDLLSARADVQSTVMNSLRAILGAAFTEKEGERVIRNTWNEADSTENNRARLQRLVENLKAQAEAKDAQSKYYEQNRTLSGYRPVSELNMSPQSSSQDTEAVRWARQNPNDPRSSQILQMNGFGG